MSVIRNAWVDLFLDVCSYDPFLSLNIDRDRYREHSGRNCSEWISLLSGAMEVSSLHGPGRINGKYGSDFHNSEIPQAHFLMGIRQSSDD